MIYQPDWDKTGTLITGMYCGHPYKGMIEHSRVCYGGDVEYKVILLDMIEVHSEWISSILVRQEEHKDNYKLLTN